VVLSGLRQSRSGQSYPLVYIWFRLWQPCFEKGSAEVCTAGRASAGQHPAIWIMVPFSLIQDIRNYRQIARQAAKDGKKQ
jgi:hypothetical protein